MWAINRANVTFPWQKYIWGNGLEYHLPKQMWKDERSEVGLATVWKPSQCAVFITVCTHVCTAAFTQQLRNTTSTSKPVSHLQDHTSFKGLKVCRSEKCAVCVSEKLVKGLQFCCQTEMTQMCFVCSSCPFLSRILCLQWALLQPDPECCESLFIKSIPPHPPWPCSSHADC